MSDQTNERNRDYAWLGYIIIASFFCVFAVALYRPLAQTTRETIKTYIPDQRRPKSRNQIYREEQARQKVWVQEMDQSFATTEERTRELWGKKLYDVCKAYIARRKVGERLIGYDALLTRLAPPGQKKLSKGGGGLPFTTWQAICKFYVECGILERRGKFYIIVVNRTEALRLVQIYTRPHIGRVVRIPERKNTAGDWVPMDIPNCLPGLFALRPEHDERDPIDPLPSASISPPVVPPLLSEEQNSENS